MELAFQLIKIAQQHIEFVLDLMMGNAMAEIGMPFGFCNMMPDFMFQVMNIYQLNVKLVVKMFDPHQHIVVGFAGGEIIQFVFKLMDFLAVIGQLVIPFVALINE